MKLLKQLNQKLVTEVSDVSLNFKPKNKFMSYIDGSVDEKMLKALAPIIKQMNFSSNQTDGAKEIMSNNSVTPGHFLWCLDSVLLFLDDAKDLIKQLKLQTKEQYTKKELTEARSKQPKLSKQQIKAGVEKAEKAFERKAPKGMDWGDNFRAFLEVVYLTAYQDGFDAKRPGLEQKLSLSQEMINDGLDSAEAKFIPGDMDWGDNLQKLIGITYETGFSEGWDDRFYQSE